LTIPFGHSLGHTDSISRDRLHDIDWWLHQVKMRTFASYAGVTQYWHWNPEDSDLIEHQVLGSAKPAKWSVFKELYNFHPKISGIREVLFARGNTKITSWLVYQAGSERPPAVYLFECEKRMELDWTMNAASLAAHTPPEGGTPSCPAASPLLKSLAST
jgi:hypothetical protein